VAVSAGPTPSSEYAAAVEGCAVFDRSERGKLALTGTQAKEFLHGQVSNDIESLTTGHGCYAALLTPKGKMLGDLRVLDSGDELLLDTERSALQELFNTIRRFRIGFEVELHKRTLERGLLSLLGPAADAVAGLTLPPEEHAHAPARIGEVLAQAIRTDLGIDLLCTAEDTAALHDELTRRGAVAISTAVAETLRIESGRPRYGVELDESVIPQEAGLNDRAVSFTKGCYVGQETVARLFYRGKPNRLLRGLVCSAPVEVGEVLRLGEREVGRVGSSTVSPRRGPLALALVRREAQPGSELSVGQAAVRATVAELPFA
jgi:tRNA-modifying protein YgfZ